MKDFLLGVWLGAGLSFSCFFGFFMCLKYLRERGR